jgi:nitroreductase
MTAKSTAKTGKSKPSPKSKPVAKSKAAAAAAKPKTAVKSVAKAKAVPKTAPMKVAKPAARKAPTTVDKAPARKSPTKAGTAAARKTPAKVTKAPAKVTKAGAKSAGPEPLELVRPLIRVRQSREFTGKKVTRAELEAITEVARWSGTSRNEQPLRFVALRDPERIRRIAELGLPQTRGLPTATAAVAIVEPNEPERGISRSFDDGRAAERMLIAAHALGLGGGISRVRPDVREGINKLLHLPANRSVRTIVAFGHPTEEARAPKAPRGKARLPREELIYEERWPDPPLKD